MDVIEVDQDAPTPVKRNDYGVIADRYNEIEVGQALRMSKVYNITLFRRTLARFGLSPADTSVYQRGGHCFIQKKSETQMQPV